MTLLSTSSLGRRASVGIALAIALVLVLSSTAHANGVDVGSREVFAGDVGPYSLSITTIPVPGTMHFNIYLVQTGTDQLVDDPTLTLSGVKTEGDGGSAGPVAGYETLVGPQWFAADVPVDSAGVWDFTLTIDSPEGSDQVTFPVAVQQPSRFNLSVLALIAIALAILGFTLGNRFTRRRRTGSGRRRPIR